MGEQILIAEDDADINNLLAKFGIEGPLWLMESTGFIVLPMWVIAFVALWQYLGQNMMLYMAQITGISRDIYEASYIDGASKVKAFRYITLPLIKPMMITSLSLNCIGSLKFFDLVYNMTHALVGILEEDTVSIPVLAEDAEAPAWLT